MDLHRELEVAIQAVRQACRVCRRVQSSLAAADTVSKRDASPVTTADFASQAVINTTLSSAFPDCPVLAEEHSSLLRDAANAPLLRRVTNEVRQVLPEVDDRAVLAAIDHGGADRSPGQSTWVLDPIDGTKGFLRGEQYAVALALLAESQVVLGILGCPNLPLTPGAATGVPGSLFFAVRGQGAWQVGLDGGQATRIRVDGIDSGRRATWCESVEAGHSSHASAAQVAHRLGTTNQPLRMDSQCKYAAVARGEASFYLRLPTRPGYREKVWDHAAGSIVVQEAGGAVSDASGAPLDFSHGRQLETNAGIIASNGLLHADVVAAVAAILSGHAGS